MIMLINMDDSRITSIAQLKDFLNGSQRVVVSLEESTIKDKYIFIEKTVRQFLYQNLKKKEKELLLCIYPAPQCPARQSVGSVKIREAKSLMPRP